STPSAWAGCAPVTAARWWPPLGARTSKRWSSRSWTTRREQAQDQGRHHGPERTGGISMSELVGRLRDVRDRAREAGADLRARALAIDTDPDAMEPHFDSPVFAAMREAQIPVEFRESAVSEPQHPDAGTCLETVVAFTETSRGDAATALAC